MYKDAFAHLNKGTSAFLQAEPMPQRSLRAEQFLHTDFLGTETNRHRENCTDRLHKGKYAPKFLHAETLPRTVFTQQKLFRTETFPDSFFHAQQFSHNILYIQTFLYTDAVTRKTNCTQRLMHTLHFYTQPTFSQRGFASPS